MLSDCNLKLRHEDAVFVALMTRLANDHNSRAGSLTEMAASVCARHQETPRQQQLYHQPTGRPDAQWEEIRLRCTLRDRLVKFDNNEYCF